MNLATVGLGAVTGILAAKFLGAEGRGVYAAVWVWYWLAVVLCELGFGQGIAYFASRHPTAVKGLLRVSVPVAVGLAAVVAGLAIVGTANLTSNRELVGSTVLAFTGLPIAVFGSLRGAVLRSLDNRRWNIGRSVQPSAYLVAVLGVAVVGRATPQAFFACLLASLVIQVAVITYLVHPFLRAAGGSGSESWTRPLFGYSMRALASTVPSALNSRVDQVVLSLLGDFRVLGTYALAVAVGSLVIPVSLGIGYTVMPHLAALDNAPAQARLARRALAYTSIATVGVTAAVVPMAVWLVPGFFGPDFAGFGRLLVLLSPGLGAFAVSRVAVETLNGLGRPGISAQGDLVALCVTLLGVLLLVDKYGASGIAVASSSGSVVGLLWLLLGVRRALSARGAREPVAT